MAIENSDTSIAKKETAYTAVSKKQSYIIFAIVSLAMMMSAIDGTIIAVALPSMLNDLQTNLAWLGWTMTGYQFSMSIMMPIAGKLSDALGRKRFFLSAVAVFVISEVAAGLAPNIYLLIIFRIIAGIGGGIFLPLAMGIISDVFGKNRATAIGLFASIPAIGAIVGPNVGGFIVDHFSWRWIFFVNVPIGIVLFFASLAILPKGVPKSRNNGSYLTDTRGLGLFMGALLSLLFALTNWANYPENFTVMTLVLFLVAGTLIYLFIKHEVKAVQPLIDITLLRWRPFVAANIYNFVFGMVTHGFFSFIPYYAIIGYNMTASETGLILTPRSIAVIITSTLTSLFIIKFRYRSPMIIGFLFIAASMFLLSRGYHDLNVLGLGLHNVSLLALFAMLMGIGSGMFNPAANNAALDLLPEKVAAITGLRGMFRNIGGLVGTAGIVLTLSFFQDKAVGMQYIFLGLAILLLLIVPLIFLVPDSARQRRNQLD